MNYFLRQFAEEGIFQEFTPFNNGTMTGTRTNENPDPDYDCSYFEQQNNLNFGSLLATMTITKTSEGQDQDG